MWRAPPSTAPQVEGGAPETTEEGPDALAIGASDVSRGPQLEETTMKIRLVFTLALIAGAAAAGLAEATPHRVGDLGFSPRPIEKVSCDNRGDDKQARCMESCDEVWIKASQAYNGNIDKAKVEKKSCEAKCGC